MLLLFDGLIFHQQEIEDFVQSSGEHGVVVFSLGSMVGTLTEERANVIAAGLAQIPQKVRNHASVWHPHRDGNSQFRCDSRNLV